MIEQSGVARGHRLRRLLQPLELSIADYPSIVEARRLAYMVGETSLAAAFLLGRVDLMVSQLTVALLGSPVHPLTTADLGSVVRRLDALPATARDSMLVNAYMEDATEGRRDPMTSRRGI